MVTQFEMIGTEMVEGQVVILEITFVAREKLVCSWRI